MIAIFYLVLQILKLYSYVVIANVIVSWLIAFNSKTSFFSSSLNSAATFFPSIKIINQLKY